MNFSLYFILKFYNTTILLLYNTILLILLLLICTYLKNVGPALKYLNTSRYNNCNDFNWNITFCLSTMSSSRFTK